MVIALRTAAAFLLLFLVSNLSGKEPVSRVTVFSEAGFYNSTYKDRKYISEYASFPVMIKSFSMEYYNIDDESFIKGGGFAGSEISEGKKFNYDRFEHQVQSVTFMPYFFLGYDFHYAALELGVSTYLNYKQFSPRLYYNSDGTTRIDRTEGIYLDRTDSHVFPNFSLRLLPERIIHFKIKMGREYFSPVDSLFVMAFAVPFGYNKIETSVSLKTYLDRLPVNNQRITFLYVRNINPFSIGASFSYLIYNEHGGGRGDIGIVDSRNVSGGLYFSLKYH